MSITKHIYTYINPVCDKDIEEAIRILDNDGVIAYPTDINWAIGCKSTSQKAITRIRQLKSLRPKDQPFSLLCSNFSMISEYAHVDAEIYRTIKRILPGPYTILLKKHKLLPKKIHDKRELVGIRMPKSPLLFALISRYEKPILTTSLPDSTDIHFGYQIMERFSYAIDLILDLGEELLPLESTVLDLSEEGEFTVVRPGVGVENVNFL